jgi:hypothetical protein
MTFRTLPNTKLTLLNTYAAAYFFGLAQRCFAPQIFVSTVGYQLNRLNFEMQSYQAEYERFQVLHEIIENPEALRIG